MSDMIHAAEPQDTAAIPLPVAETAEPLIVVQASVASGTPATAMVAAVATIMPQDCGCQAPAAAGGAATPTAPPPPIFIYALGRIRAAISSTSVENELQQANWLNFPNSDISSLQYLVLSQPRNAYLARAMCWILQIDAAEALEPNGALIDTFVDAYVLKPQTTVEMSALISALEPSIDATDIRYTVIQGLQGPLATEDMCNGLQLPIVVVNAVNTFTRGQIMAQIQVAAQVPEQSGLLLDQMLQAAGNAGNAPEYRALNWLAVQGFDVSRGALGVMGFDVYKVLGAMQGYSTDQNSPFRVPGNFQFSGISTSQMSGGTRTVVNVVLYFREKITGSAVNWFCQVDVSGEFPFMARPFSRYYTNP
jgi:hypothetical protein